MNTSSLVKKIIGGILSLVTIMLPNICDAQEIIVTEQGDTLVTITPDQVRTINIVFEDHRLLEEKSSLQAERLELMERRIEKGDTVILKYSNLVDELKKEMVLKEIAYKNTQRKEKVRYFIIGGVTGVVVGSLVTFLLCK